MSSVSRTSQFSRVHKILKKHYKPVAPDARRSVLDHLLFACCLEDAHYEAAEEAFAALGRTFFDWNEVRVTTISELAEVMAGLPDPRAAANRVKRVLQSIFETTYNFDLEEHRKNNLGPTVKWLEKIDGTSPFVVAYTVQAALAGHWIPIGPKELQALRLMDLISEEDLQKQVVPGMERAVPKSKGVEFGSLLHQFVADFIVNPYSPRIREIFLEINPECKDRLPKRRLERKAAKKPATAPAAEPAGAEEAKKPPRRAAEGRGKKSPPAAAAETPKPPAKESAAAKAEAPAEGAKAASARKKAAAKPPSGDGAKRKSASQGLAKRKPR